MFTSILSLGLVSLLATTSTAAPTPAPLVTRSSSKKGVAYENPSVVPLFGDKVGWCYNWVSASKFGSSPPNNIEFVPMLHSDEAMWTNVWKAEFEASYSAGARHVLSFNEPDQCGGGGVCMKDVGRTVAAHKQWIDGPIGPRTDVKIGAPAITNGEHDENGNIMGIEYLKQFLAGCSGCRIDFLVAHWYKEPNVTEFISHIGNVWKAGGEKIPVWVTEFAPYGDDATKKAFLAEAVNELDALPYVERYAYHYATNDILLNAAGNELSDLGAAYVSK